MKLKSSGESLLAIFRLFTLIIEWDIWYLHQLFWGGKLCFIDFFLPLHTESPKLVLFLFGKGGSTTKQTNLEYQGMKFYVNVTVWLLGKSPLVCTANSLSYSGWLGAVCCVQRSMSVTPGKNETEIKYDVQQRSKIKISPCRWYNWEREMCNPSPTSKSLSKIHLHIFRYIWSQSWRTVPVTSSPCWILPKSYSFL